STSRSGWSIGSPPLNATTDVPSEASLSIRASISSVDTGADTLSYSLQYPQSMLQRRIGTTWTSSGWSVLASPRANSRTDRHVRLAFRTLRIETDIISGARAFPHPPHRIADAQRVLEDRADTKAPPEPVAGARAQARRRHAAAVRAIGRPAKLARRDLALEVGRHAGRRPGEHAFVRRSRGI